MNARKVLEIKKMTIPSPGPDHKTKWPNGKVGMMSEDEPILIFVRGVLRMIYFL